MRKFFTLIAFFAISTMAFAQSSQNLIMPAPAADKEIRASAVAGQASRAFDDIKIDVKPGDSFQSGTSVIPISRILHGQISQMGPEDNYNWTYEPHSNTLFFMTTANYRVQGQPTMSQRRGELWFVNVNDPNIANTNINSENPPVGPWRRLIMYDTIQESVPTTAPSNHWEHATVVASNPSQSTNVNDVYVGFVAKFTERMPGTGTTYVDKHRWFGFNTVGNLLQGIPTIDVEVSKPYIFNPGLQYSFHYMKGNSAVIDGKPIGFFYGYSTDATVADTTNQLIKYNFVAIDLSNTNPDDAVEISQNLPTTITGGAGQGSVFNSTVMEGNRFGYHTTRARNEVYYSHQSVDFDNNGNAYFAFVNALSIHINDVIHPDYLGIRLPVVIKTKYTKDGSLALNFNDMDVDSIPLDVILNYINSNGGVANTDLTQPPLSPSMWGFHFGFWNDGQSDIAFTVLGENEYSFILPFYYNDGGNNIEGNHYLQYVEVTSKNKVWTIRKVADILGRSPVQPSASAGSLQEQMHYYYTQPFGDPPRRTVSTVPGFFTTGNKWQSTAPSTDNMYVGHSMRDLQIAKTRDNQYLIAKWVSVHDSDAINFPDTLKMRVRTSEIRILEIPRIFRGRMMMAWRDVNNPTWSTPVTVYCSDTISMLRTYMPRIVPSRTLVPVTYYKSEHQDQPEQAAFKVIHPIMGNAFIPEYAANDLILANAMVTFPCYNCIEEGDFTNVHNLEAFPNPPVNEITFRFSVVQPAHTTLVVTNALGQTIATVVDQFFEGGKEYTTKFNTANLPIGTYYYTLTAGPRVETKMFTVVR